MSNMDSITTISQVELHFSITLQDGSIADSTRVNGSPAILKMGQNLTCEAFEKQLLGLSKHDKKTFTLNAGEAMDKPNPDNIKTLSRALFATEIGLENGLIINFDQSNGQSLPGVVREFDDEHVIVDFNHPLAGHSLTFDVEILSIS